MEFNRIYEHYILDKKHNSIKIPQFNIPISIKVICVFNRSYIDETDIYRIATENNNKILSVISEGDKKKYIYENNSEIIRYMDINQLKSISNTHKELISKIKIYPFMQNHHISFRYAGVVIISEKINNNIQFICDINYCYRGLKLKGQSIGIIREPIIFDGCKINSMEDWKDFEELIENFKAKIYMKYKLYYNGKN